MWPGSARPAWTSRSTINCPRTIWDRSTCGYANYLDRLEFIGTPGAPITNERREAYKPRYQLNMDLTWKKGPLSVNYGLSWYDKTLRYTNQEVSGNPDIVAPQYLYYKERWVHDIYASYNVDERFQLYGGVNNVFGQRPDIGANTYPVSSVGRFFYIGAKVKMADMF